MKKQGYKVSPFATKSPQLVVVGSKNPVKIACTQEAFDMAFPKSISVEGVAALSGVSDQPFGLEETWLGAKNRALHARQLRPEANYWLGIEGGVAEDQGGMYAFAWIFILHSSGKTSQAQTGTFYLPSIVVDLIRQGRELGEADDLVFKERNSKQKGGSVGLLTQGLLTREAYYKQAILLSLIPFLNQELFPNTSF